MIIQELEVEVAAYESRKARLRRDRALEEEREQATRTTFATSRRASRTLTRQIDHAKEKPNGVPSTELEAERGRAKRALERVRGRLRNLDAEVGSRSSGASTALPPVLGLAPQGGGRAVELRRAGRGVRVPLHLPRIEFSVVLTPAVLSEPPRRYGARDRGVAGSRVVTSRHAWSSRDHGDVRAPRRLWVGAERPARGSALTEGARTRPRRPTRPTRRSRKRDRPPTLRSPATQTFPTGA